jgi:hypothetical protein
MRNDPVADAVGHESRHAHERNFVDRFHRAENGAHIRFRRHTCDVATAAAVIEESVHGMRQLTMTGIDRRRTGKRIRGLVTEQISKCVFEL